LQRLENITAALLTALISVPVTATTSPAPQTPMGLLGLRPETHLDELRRAGTGRRCFATSCCK